MKPGILRALFLNNICGFLRDADHHTGKHVAFLLNWCWLMAQTSQKLILKHFAPL
jgi:hypothetical protein